MTITGVDTSNHNHPGGAAINWPALAASGARFAILKATEGVGFTDAYLASDRAGAHGAGLIVLLYHFARSGDPVAQARYFLSAVGRLQVGEGVVVDDEDPAITPAWVKAFCDTIYAATTVKPLVYINQSYQNTQDWSAVVADNDGEWLARYDGSTVQPSGGPWGAPAMKQYTSTGRAVGIAGPVDLDVFYGTDAQLLAYGLQSTPTSGGFLMALTDTEQTELLSNSRQIRDYLGANGGGGTATPDTVGYKVNDIQAALTSALPVLTAAANPQAVADAVVAKIQALPAPQAAQVAQLVLAGLNGAQLSVTPPAA